MVVRKLPAGIQLGVRLLHELRVLGPGRGHHLRRGPGGGPRQAAEGGVGEYQDIQIYLCHFKTFIPSNIETRINVTYQFTF